MLNPYDRERRESKKYAAKKSIVKDLWIGSGLVMVGSQSVPMIFAMGLLTTFVSFAILDETP